MIVDVHYHHMSAMVEAAARDMMKYVRHVAGAIRVEIDEEAMVKKALETWPDPTGERLIAGMDEAGVDVTCICRVDNAGNPAMTRERIQEGNQAIGAIAQKYPDRVLALAGVDPRRPEAPEMLRRCFEEFGVRGLKYHPDHGYNPSGPESYKVLEVLQEFGGVLLSHTGPLPPPSRARFADPLLLSDLAVDFPGVKVIAAHMGMINWQPWASMASFQPNLYGDLAMWDAMAEGHYDLFCRNLRDILDYVGPHKVLFGTDSPFFSVLIPVKRWVELIRNLPDNAPAGINFTQEEVDAILGGNAAGVFGL